MTNYNLAIQRRIEQLRTELGELEATQRVIARFNGKADRMDQQARAFSPQSLLIPRGGRKTSGMYGKRGPYKRRNGVQTSDANGALDDAQRAAIAGLDREWEKTNWLKNTRPLMLLDNMNRAGIPLTHDNVLHLYRDVLKWGNRPLSQVRRYKYAKRTKDVWRLLDAGAEKVKEARAFLARRDAPAQEA